LDLLALDGVNFTSAFSQSNESMFSHASMMTGMLPSEVSKPNYLTFILNPNVLTLAEALSSIGYQTGAFIAGGHIKARFGFEQGFDQFGQSADYGSFFETVPMAMKWMRKANPEKPFFTFVHGYDCHRPYAHRGIFWHPFDSDYQGIVDSFIKERNETEKIFNGIYYPNANLEKVWHSNGEHMLDPRQYRSQAEGKGVLGNGITLTTEDLNHLKAHYDSGVLAADTYVGLLIDQMKRTGLWENSLMIVTSDHGEDLQDHGFTNHRAVIHDSTTAVPMIISGGALPEHLRGTTYTGLVDALDITPTIMGMAGSIPPSRARGENLWSALQNQTTSTKSVVYQQGVLGQTAVRTATHRLLFSGLPLTDNNYLSVMKESDINSKYFSLYAIHSDPNEHENVVEAEQELAETLRHEMVRITMDLYRATTEQPLDAHSKKMLQERGYW
jgi:arylsulfatase A-like enzyme